MAKSKRIKITLVKSTIGQKPAKRATVRCLGLKKINSSVEHELNPCISGMIAAVSHLVKVEELN
ncbi:MAG: 50S ribosomal protein L30 [Spirochaetaceae bacterium]|nr:50S ribosomal protein L30 [Spirochaetaceae bacterium]